MKVPVLPENEAQRLSSLRSLDVLDTPAEERFDRITRLTRSMFGVPTALVSLVDAERQWFKSRQGLGACETSRDVSFCGHAILSDEVLWVEDALEDERFLDNPLVTDGPKIRFYAGCPLHDADGNRLGTLCVIDQEPRPYMEDEVQSLMDLAELAQNELVAKPLHTSRLELPIAKPAERKDLLDEATGVWNRAGILEILDDGLSQCAENGWPATILLCELDEGSQLSETWSAQGSDIILSEVAQVLRGCVRNYDSIGRTGDSRFLILLAGLSAQDATQRVAYFQHRIDQNPVLQAIGVRMHFGFASTRRRGDGPGQEELLQSALESIEDARQRRGEAA